MLRRSGGGHLIDLDQVRAFHAGAIDATDAALDAALGLPPRTPSGAPFEDLALTARHPGESFADLPTPHALARGLFTALAPGPESVVVDLGCGHGRVVLYGAAVTPARLVGVEIVEERAEIARAAGRRLGFGERVAIATGNVLDHDLSRGDVFYMFRPFGELTEAEVVARLHDEARRRPIVVATARMARLRFDPDVFEALGTGLLTIHRSRHPAGDADRAR